MCDPVSLLVAGTVASTAATVKSAKDAKKERARSAAEAKAAADAEQRERDLEARGARDDDYKTRRKTRAGQADYGASPFSPRSFFIPA